jgi:ribonuclease HI
MHYVAYTDGSCVANGKRNARAGVGVYFGDDHELNYSAPLSAPPHTNQRAELEGVLRAVQLAEQDANGRPFTLQIYTDSQYALKCVTVWVKSWRRNGWRTANGGPVQNKDLIEPLAALLDRLGCVTITHVRGHQGVFGNEYADFLANLGAGVDAPEPKRQSKQVERDASPKRHIISKAPEPTLTFDLDAPIE